MATLNTKNMLKAFMTATVGNVPNDALASTILVDQPAAKMRADFWYDTKDNFALALVNANDQNVDEFGKKPSLLSEQERFMTSITSVKRDAIVTHEAHDGIYKALPEKILELQDTEKKLAAAVKAAKSEKEKKQILEEQLSPHKKSISDLMKEKERYDINARSVISRLTELNQKISTSLAAGLGIKPEAPSAFKPE